jgi:hypothetical protein
MKGNLSWRMDSVQARLPPSALQLFARQDSNRLGIRRDPGQPYSSGLTLLLRVGLRLFRSYRVPVVNLVLGFFL